SQSFRVSASEYTNVTGGGGGGAFGSGGAPPRRPPPPPRPIRKTSGPRNSRLTCTLCRETTSDTAARRSVTNFQCSSFGRPCGVVAPSVLWNRVQPIAAANAVSSSNWDRLALNVGSSTVRTFGPGIL